MTDLELQSQETEALLKKSERPKQRALAIHIVAQTASRSYDVSARLVGLARFLLAFIPGPRRSVSTQTDSKPRRSVATQTDAD